MTYRRKMLLQLISFFSNSATSNDFNELVDFGAYFALLIYRLVCIISAFQSFLCDIEVFLVQFKTYKIAVSVLASGSS